MTETLSPNARADEAEDIAFHARHEAERKKRLEPPSPRQPTARQIREAIATGAAIALAEALKEIARLEKRVDAFEAERVKYVGT